MLDRIRGKSQSVVTYVIFGLIIVSFVFLGIGRFTGGSSSAVATVNGELIQAQEFAQNAYKVYMAEAQKQPELAADDGQIEVLKRRVLDRMIFDMVQEQEAKRLGIFVSPQEFFQIVSGFSAFHNEKGEFDQAVYTKVLAEQNLPVAKFEIDLKNSILGNKLLGAVAMSVNTTEDEAKSFFRFKLERRSAEYVLFAKKDYESKAEVSDDEMKAAYEAKKAAFVEPARMNLEYVTVTPKTLAAGFAVSDDDAKAYYEKNPEQFAIPEQYKARHILIAAPAPGATDENSVKAVAAAEELIKKLAKELKEGADFVEYAKQHSADQGSSQNGGELGWLSKGDQIVPEFEAAALALAPGQTSEPVRTEYGFHLIKMDEKKPAGKMELAKIKDEIKQTIAVDLAAKEEDAIRKNLVEDLNNGTPLADIAKKYSLKVETTGVVEKDNLSKLLMLHSDAMPILENVAVGDIAPVPVNVTDGVALVKVLASEPSRTLAFDEVKDRVRTQLVDEKALAFAKKEAEGALAEFTGTEVPAAYKGKVQESTPFSRVMPLVMPFGIQEALVDTLSGMQPGLWASRTFDTPEGTLIARVKEIIPTTDEEWAQQGAMVYEALVQGNQNDAIQLYMQRLLERSKIEIHENMFAQVRFK